jgi:hypothetical protein
MLTAEEGGVSYLHYGFFERDSETMREAQERATAELLRRLPPPPARLLDVGSGVGTTLARLSSLGYDAEGITPDEKQVAAAGAANIRCLRFEDLPPSHYDTVIFQESAQYIDADALFAKAREITQHVIVFDEFAMEPSTLHSYDDFMRAAETHGFRKTEEIDVSGKAAPSVDYFNQRLERFRTILIDDLGITNEQVDDLIAGGIDYRDRYARGAYVYRMLQFRR